MWLAFLGIVIALLTFDLGVLHKKTREIEVKESLILSVVYITLGLAFGVWVWWYLGAELGMADPMWGASMAFRVWSEAVTPEGMLHEVVPGYEPARS